MSGDSESQEDREEALYHQWRHLVGSQQHERAIEVLHELLSLDPESDWTHGQLGWAFYQTDQYDQALSSFQKAIEIDPTESSYFEGLAWVHYSRNKLRPSEDACRKAIELNPDDPDPWFLMARIMVRLDDPEGAQRFLENASRVAPEDPRILQIQTDIGSLDDATHKLTPTQQLANYQQMLAREPESAYLHYRIGHLYLDELGNPKAAEESFRHALKSDPSDSDYQKSLMQAIRKRDLFLRILWSPANLGLWLFEKYSQLWDMKWPIIFLIFTWWAFIGTAISLLVIFFFLCWPMAKFYEVCTMADIHRKMGRIALYSGPTAFIHRLPFAARLSLFGAIFAAFWTIVIVALQDPENYNRAAAGLGVLTVILVRLFLFAGLVYWIWSSIAKRRRKRRNRHLQIPPDS